MKGKEGLILETFKSNFSKFVDTIETGGDIEDIYGPMARQHFDYLTVNVS